MKAVQRHTVVENWDDDFADEDEDELEHADLDVDADLGLEGGAAGSSLALPSEFASDMRRSASSLGLGLLSPRSVHSLRHAHAAGLDADSRTGGEESESDSDEESWDDDEEDHDQTDAGAYAEERVSVAISAQLLDTGPEPASEPDWDSRNGPTTPTLLTVDASAQAQLLPRPSFAEANSQSPSITCTTAAATSTTLASHPETPSPTAPSSAPSSPPPFSPVSSPPSHQNETEFGAKPCNNTQTDAGEDDGGAEVEDEDATITARSRPRRRTRPVLRVSDDGPVPPVPAVPSTTPPSVLHAPVQPAFTPATDTRGDAEGPAVPRAPVFSPPTVSATPSSSSSSAAARHTSASSAPRPSTATTSARPSTASSIRPSTSSSARPSTSSFARPSTSSSVRPSTSTNSSGPGTGLRPRPASSKAQTQTQQAQRSSIASLLSVYTHRSRASSVSVSASASASGPQSRRISTATTESSSSSNAPPRTSISSWTQRLFSSASGGGHDGKARQRQSVDEPRTRRVSGESRYGYAGRQSLDVLREGETRPAAAAARRGVAPALKATGTAAEARVVEGEGGAGGERDQTKSGVLGFFGRRKRSNTVAVTMPSSSAAKASAEEEDVYANKKASKSQRSLLMLGRAPSLLARRASRIGKSKPKDKDVDAGVAVGVDVGAKGVKSPPHPPAARVSMSELRDRAPPAPDVVQDFGIQQPAPRGTKRRIPGGRASLPPLAVMAPTSSAVRDADHEGSIVNHTYAQVTSRSTPSSLSSIGELRIPSRISQAQVSIRRDLGLVKEFAGKVAELKDLQGSYLQMIESVQGMIDADPDHGQPLPTVVKTPSRPRSNTSPALSRPPSRSPLAALFQGPDPSLNAISSDSPTTPTPVTPATPSSTPYSSADLAQRMADITARYDSWWECAELLIELGNTPPSVPTPVSTVRLVPPTSVLAATLAPLQPPTPTPAVTVASGSQGEGDDAPLAPAVPEGPAPSSSYSSNHAESTLKPSRGRANTFAGHMPVARLRSASTSTASMAPGGAPHPLLSPSASAASSAPSHTWRATTGRHDLSHRQLVLLRQMLGVDKQKQQRPPAAPTTMTTGPEVAMSNADGDEDLDGDEESDGAEDATWRWGHATTVQLPSPAEEKEAYFGIAARRKEHRRPWSRAYHSSDITHSEDEDHELAVYVTPAPEPLETKKSKGMNAIRDMLKTLKRAHPPTPRSSTFPPISVEAPPRLAAAAPKMSLESARSVLNLSDSLLPSTHAIRRAASLLPLSTTAPSSRVRPSSSSSVSRASKIDPTLAFAMTPDNIKPLLDNAREVSARLGECVADVQALLASAGVDGVSS